jgi:hypothetical protein
MDTDSKAEILARLERRRKLIEKSKTGIEKSNFLINQSHRLIRIAMGQDDTGSSNKPKADDDDSRQAEIKRQRDVFHRG